MPWNPCLLIGTNSVTRDLHHNCLLCFLFLAHNQRVRLWWCTAALLLYAQAVNYRRLGYWAGAIMMHWNKRRLESNLLYGHICLVKYRWWTKFICLLCKILCKIPWHRETERFQSALQLPDARVWNKDITNVVRGFLVATVKAKPGCAAQSDIAMGHVHRWRESSKVDYM